ncbi:MAG: GlsB/YeaQ/YmgE family stress response membrane protein [Candidatus Acidiferrum sp.]
MQVLIWIFIGLVAGWLAGKSLEGNGYGLSMDLAMGVAGALAGGFLTRAFGASGYGGAVLTTFVAVCCAALLTVLVALVNGKTVYARNF